MDESINVTREAEKPPGRTKADHPVSSDKSLNDDSVEVPFTDYATAHQKPYTVEYFELSDLWDDPDGGFTEEVSVIDEYFTKQIEKGEISNDINSVKKALKEIEKLNDLKDEDRKTVKIGTIAAYVKFLMEVDGIKYNTRKYGTK